MDKYKEIDTDALANELAHDKWKEGVVGVPDEDIHELVLEDGKMKKQVRPHWASKLFALKELYQRLIDSFAKEVRESTAKE